MTIEVRTEQMSKREKHREMERAERGEGRRVEKEESESTLWTASWWSTKQEEGLDSCVSARESRWWWRARVWRWIQRAALLFKSLISSLSLPLSSYNYLALSIFSLSFLPHLKYFCDSHAGILSSVLILTLLLLSVTLTWRLYILTSYPPLTCFPSVSFSYGCRYHSNVRKHSTNPHHPHWFISVYKEAIAKCLFFVW